MKAGRVKVSLRILERMLRFPDGCVIGQILCQDAEAMDGKYIEMIVVGEGMPDLEGGHKIPEVMLTMRTKPEKQISDWELEIRVIEKAPNKPLVF